MNTINTATELFVVLEGWRGFTAKENKAEQPRVAFDVEIQPTGETLSLALVSKLKKLRLSLGEYCVYHCADKRSALRTLQYTIERRIGDKRKEIEDLITADNEAADIVKKGGMTARQKTALEWVGWSLA